MPYRLDKPVRPLPVAAFEARSVAYTPTARRGFAGAGRYAAHAMLLQAGRETPDTRLPRLGPRTLASGPSPVYVPEAAATLRRTEGASRWAVDAWALWREGSDAPLVAGQPSYGRSQAGAVLRYRLAPASAHAPQLHLRASAALEGVRENEVAVGASARPLPDVPVRLAAEARVTQTGRGEELRGAAYAVTELPRVTLPAGFSGETYAQAGYVTGDFATAFVDGQMRITRPLLRDEGFRLEAGGGAWGGAQRGAARLDVGPTATASVRLGRAQARISADYRFRVAGDAEPESGPAITISAGF